MSQAARRFHTGAGRRWPDALPQRWLLPFSRQRQRWMPCFAVIPLYATAARYAAATDLPAGVLPVAADATRYAIQARPFSPSFIIYIEASTPPVAPPLDAGCR
jgi:hypothetical protein